MRLRCVRPERAARHRCRSGRSSAAPSRLSRSHLPTCPIIALGILLVAFLALDDARRSAGEAATGERWLVHQHQSIERIAVAGAGGGDETEVVWKFHARG